MDAQDAFIVLGDDEDIHSSLETEVNSLWEVILLIAVVLGILIFLAYRKWKIHQARKKTLAIFNFPYSGSWGGDNFKGWKSIYVQIVFVKIIKSKCKFSRAFNPDRVCRSLQRLKFSLGTTK